MAGKKHKKRKNGARAWEQAMEAGHGHYSPPPYPAGYGPYGPGLGGPGQGQGQGLFDGLARLLPSRTSDQFLLGALIGAAATYVLADEAMRGKLIKSGLSLYTSLVGGLEEMKEQVADIKAEMAAGQGEAP